MGRVSVSWFTVHTPRYIVRIGVGPGATTKKIRPTNLRLPARGADAAQEGVRDAQEPEEAEEQNQEAQEEEEQEGEEEGKKGEGEDESESEGEGEEEEEDKEKTPLLTCLTRDLDSDLESSTEEEDDGDGDEDESDEEVGGAVVNGGGSPSFESRIYHCQRLEPGLWANDFVEMLQ